MSVVPRTPALLAWADPTRSTRIMHNSNILHSSRGILKAYKDGEADFIIYSTEWGSEFYGMGAYKLHSSHEGYRSYVRALTNFCYENLLQGAYESIA